MLYVLSNDVGGAQCTLNGLLSAGGGGRRLAPGARSTGAAHC